MIEMKKIFIGLFVFIFIHIEQVSSKSLPPGTGAGDVPANILIMLDKSGSMGWRMSGGTASMRYPYDADADSNVAVKWPLQKLLSCFLRLSLQSS